MSTPDGPTPPGESPRRERQPADAGPSVTSTELGDTSFTLKGLGEADDVPPCGGREPGEGSTSEGVATYQPPMVGRRVGKYVLATKLGAGRQSVVWRAVRVEPPVQVVALKVFTPEWTLDRMERVARIRNEATRGRPLEDSAIMPVYEYGVVRGHVYYVMPLIDGLSLGQTLRKRREFLANPSPRRLKRLYDLPEVDYYPAVARLLGKVARGLGGLHAQGIVHCDVKPDNILLDWADRPFLSDFGLACALDDEPAAARSGRAMGTPLYMAPEKLTTCPDRDERRCDVFSLGVTLYETATLCRPVQLPADLPRYAWAPFLAAARPRCPRQLAPALPAALEAIILRAMNRDPACRHPTAAELADDLDNFLLAEVTSGLDGG